MGDEGLEPSRYFYQGGLSPQRLPVPPIPLLDCVLLSGALWVDVILALMPLVVPLHVGDMY